MTEQKKIKITKEMIKIPKIKLELKKVIPIPKEPPVFYPIPDHVSIKYFGQVMPDYKIARDGSVLSMKRGSSGKVMSQTPSSNGYSKLEFGLGHGTKGKSVHMHCLIGETWVANPHNNPYLDHINRDRFDNRVENLRWVSAVFNLLNNSVRQSQYYCISPKGRYWRTKVQAKYLGTYSTEISAAKVADKYIVDNNLLDYPLNFPEDYPDFHSTCGICNCQK
jgi:hypothetical protein